MRLWGNNRQEGLMAASPPIPKSTIKYSNGILLEGRGRKGFQMVLGKNRCGRKFKERSGYLGT